VGGDSPPSFSLGGLPPPAGLHSLPGVAMLGEAKLGDEQSHRRFAPKPSYSRPYLGRFRPPVEQVGVSQHAKFARGFEPRTTFSSRQVA
jgi:hypothetical protein